MDDVKRIQELLEMHCSFRMDGCDCVDMKEKCSACLARHLVGHGVTIPVRCNECHYYIPDGEYCGMWGECRHPEHFCDEGVRETK